MSHRVMSVGIGRVADLVAGCVLAKCSTQVDTMADMKLELLLELHRGALLDTLATVVERGTGFELSVSEVQDGVLPLPEGVTKAKHAILVVAICDAGRRPVTTYSPLNTHFAVYAKRGMTRLVYVRMI